MENAASLMHTNKPVLDAITKLFIAYGYEVNTKELNTADYGLPQHRVRVYLIDRSAHHMPLVPNHFPHAGSMFDNNKSASAQNMCVTLGFKG